MCLPAPLLSYFPWLFVWGGCTIICFIMHIYPGKAEFLSLLCSFMMGANNRIHNGSLIVFVCLNFTLTNYHHYAGVFVCLLFTLPNYHHYEDVSKGMERLKYFQVHSCECVSKIKSSLSITLHAIHGAVCIQPIHFAYADCEDMCTLSYYHNQIGNMTHLPIVKVRSWKMVCAVCLSVFFYKSTFETCSTPLPA